MGKQIEIFPRHGRVIYENDKNRFGSVVIKEKIIKAGIVRMLLVNEGQESASFIDKELRNELVFKYTVEFATLLRARDYIKDTLLIGGAGFSFPKYYISHFPDKNIDVVEIDPEMVEIAKKYFYLDELIEEYNPIEEGRLGIIIDDGMHYLRMSSKKYDLIMNDAYIGKKFDDELFKKSQVSLIKEHLNERGIYGINLITALKGNQAKLGELEMMYLEEQFKYTRMYSCDDDINPIYPQNCVLLASDKPIY